MNYIESEFYLNDTACEIIRKKTPSFGYNGFGEIVYYRSYSRTIRDDLDNVLGQEDWHDTVIRVINGVMSIRKDHYIRNRIHWDEIRWQKFAYQMAVSMFQMEWLPPGRGLWAMGTPLVAKRGAMALYNCAATMIGDDWIEDLCWLMDTLMFGVGVGFRPVRTGLTLQEPSGVITHSVEDTREGWVDALRLLLNAFQYGGKSPTFTYEKVRPFGSPIRTFGGTASGPEPLMKMLDTVNDLCYKYARNQLDEIQFKTDLANLCGVCVVAGNVRRSAEIAVCEFDDPVFHSLKDYTKYPYRAEWGWMSNNSVLLTQDDDFCELDLIAQANINGHDVGYLNMRNVRYGRLGKRDNFPLDRAIGLNPCGEIPLEHREVCNLAETLPTRCVDTERWLEACKFATFYCSTVTLLPTHQPSTNVVINRNRRIGVSLIDFTGWQDSIGTANVIAALRRGYNFIRETNKIFADEAGIPVSIRVTTVKPGGTVPKMAGRQSGAGYPTFRYTLRRINVGVGTPIDKCLIAAGVPFEDSAYTPNTHVFEYPIEQGPARPATEVTLWEQAMNLILLQREWADNAVSNTLYFKPKWSKIATDGRESNILGLKYSFNLDRQQVGLTGKECDYQVRVENGVLNLYRYNENHEEDQVADVLSHIAPLTKSVSLLPHSDVGIFRQMPEEGITKEEYEKRLSAIKSIDWSKFSNSDGQDEKYCEGDKCIIQQL